MTQKILDLNEGEQKWLEQNLQVIRGIVVSLLGKEDIDPLLPANLDEAYAAWDAGHQRVAEDPNPRINAFGIGFGQYLAGQLDLTWKIVEDESGTDIALHDSPGDILLFPTNLVAKRYEKSEKGFFVPLHEGISKQVEEI